MRQRAELERSRETGRRGEVESEQGLEPDLESAGRLHGVFLGQEGLSSPGDSDVLGRGHVAALAPKGTFWCPQAGQCHFSSPRHAGWLLPASKVKEACPCLA